MKIFEVWFSLNRIFKSDKDMHANYLVQKAIAFKEVKNPITNQIKKQKSLRGLHQRFLSILVLLVTTDCLG